MQRLRMSFSSHNNLIAHNQPPMQKDNAKQSLLSKALLKTRIRAFAYETTMHGFKELYLSRHWWIRIGWSVAIIFCASALIYQTVQMTYTYMDEPTTTVVYPLTDGAYPLPTVEIGVRNFAWVNYSKAIQLGLTPEMLVVLKSMLNVGVVWPVLFNVSIVKQALFDLIKQRNFTNVQQLTAAIAYRNPLGLVSAPSRMADDRDACALDSMCQFDECQYRMNSEKAVQIQQTSGSSLKGVLRIDHRYVKNELQNNRRNYVRFYQPENSSDGMEYPELVAEDHTPVLYVTDSWEPLKLFQGQDYMISYTVRLYKYLSSSARPCREMDKGDRLYERLIYAQCEMDCQIRANMTFRATDCFPLDYIDSPAQPWPLCSSGVIFGDDMELHGMELPVARELSREEEKRRKKAVEQCIKWRCLTTCNQYAFDVSVLAPPRSNDDWERTKVSTAIILRYPANKSVLVTEERVAYTWDMYVSNLGGILGLWLGASMMSFFQIAYLCACPHKIPDDDEEQKEDNLDLQRPSDTDKEAWKRRIYTTSALGLEPAPPVMHY